MASSYSLLAYEALPRVLLRERALSLEPEEVDVKRLSTEAEAEAEADMRMRG